MSVNGRLKRIERQLGVGRNIQRTVLVFCRKTESEAEEAEQQAEIDRRVQEAIERDPTNPFVCLFG